MDENERNLRKTARIAFAALIRNRKIIRLRKCQQCGRRGKTEGHHHNGYSNPADVMWLCMPCHKKYHIKDLYVFKKEDRTGRPTVTPGLKSKLYGITLEEPLYLVCKHVGPKIVRKWLQQTMDEEYYWNNY